MSAIARSTTGFVRSTVLALLLLPVTWSVAATPPWILQPQTGIGVNIWAPAWYAESITRFDAETLAESLHRAGATVAFTFQGFSQDHQGMSFFPTELGPMHPNLNGRDFLAEYITACHRAGIRIFGYYSFIDKKVWQASPEWRQKDARGQEIRPTTHDSLCLNTGYREHFIRRISELVERHALDGLLLDGVGFRANGCFCAGCEQAYRAGGEGELPRPVAGRYDEATARFFEWRYATTAKFHADVRAALKRIRPELVITHNAFHFLRWAMVDDQEVTVRADDVGTTLIDWHGGTGEVPLRFPDMIWRAGMVARFLRDIAGKPAFMQVGNFMYGRDYQVAPVAELRLAACSIVTNGGSPVYITNAYPEGTVDELANERIGAVFRDLRAKAPFLTELEDVPFAVLYLSKESQDYSTAVHSSGRSHHASFEGAYKALMEEHIPFRLLGPRGLTTDGLKRYKVLVLPDAGVLSDAHAAIVREFVRDGGAVVGTGRTSLIASTGARRSSFALADVFGADYAGAYESGYAFIQTEGQPLGSGIDPRERVPIRTGFQEKIIARSESKRVARFVGPAADGALSARPFALGPNDIPPGLPTDAPQAIAVEFGRGRSVYFAADITGLYGRFGYPSLRRLLVNAVNWASRDANPIVVHAPLGVEARAYRQGSRIIVQLLNYVSSQVRGSHTAGGPAVEDSIPVHDIRVEVQTPVKRAFLASSGQRLPVAANRAISVVVIPRLDVHDIVVLE